MNKNTLFAFITGLVFGVGLILAGMTNPAKVISFLDISALWKPLYIAIVVSGENSTVPLLWDPSLAFVMMGGIAIGAIAFAIAKKREASLLGSTMHLPVSRTINKRLVLGSLTFGIGWGLAGVCPGPGIVLLGTGSLKGLFFVLAMLVGMGIFELYETRRLFHSK
ncbi:MAG: DUF6691 family protein [Methylophilaceae bacterium]